MDAARARDGDAWTLIYCRIYPRLRAYLVRRLGSADVDDALSETMARAVGGIDRFTLGPAGIDGWVFGIARRVVLDHHRRSGRARRLLPPPVDRADGDAGEALSQSEDRRRMRGAFQRLTAAEREILELRVVAGLSAEQVAAVLGKRPGAVRTAQSRALAHLRALMEDDR